MWKVTATGASGRTYVYEVDAPDYAPEDAVWDAACRKHGQEKRAGNVREFLDIRPGTYQVTMIRPEGWKPADKEEILKRAAAAGLTLEASDIVQYGSGFRVDGMDAEEWLAALASD